MLEVAVEQRPILIAVYLGQPKWTCTRKSFTYYCQFYEYC